MKQWLKKNIVQVILFAVVASAGNIWFHSRGYDQGQRDALRGAWKLDAAERAAIKAEK